MNALRKAKLLRIFVGEDHRYQHKPLYEVIVQKAHESGLAGATVIRGVMSYGVHAKLHTARVLRLAEDMPIVIEIVDQEDAIRAFLPVVDSLVSEGLVTVETVEVIQYRGPKPHEDPE